MATMADGRETSPDPRPCYQAQRQPLATYRPSVSVPASPPGAGESKSPSIRLPDAVFARADKAAAPAQASSLIATSASIATAGPSSSGSGSRPRGVREDSDGRPPSGSSLARRPSQPGAACSEETARLRRGLHGATHRAEHRVRVVFEHGDTTLASGRSGKRGGGAESGHAREGHGGGEGPAPSATPMVGAMVGWRERHESSSAESSLCPSPSRERGIPFGSFLALAAAPTARSATTCDGRAQRSGGPGRATHPPPSLFSFGAYGANGGRGPAAVLLGRLGSSGTSAAPRQTPLSRSTSDLSELFSLSGAMQCEPLPRRQPSQLRRQHTDPLASPIVVRGTARGRGSESPDPRPVAASPFPRQTAPATTRPAFTRVHPQAAEPRPTRGLCFARNPSTTPLSSPVPRGESAAAAAAHATDDASAVSLESSVADRSKASTAGSGQQRRQILRQPCTHSAAADATTTSAPPRRFTRTFSTMANASTLSRTSSTASHSSAMQRQAVCARGRTVTSTAATHRGRHHPPHPAPESPATHRFSSLQDRYDDAQVPLALLRGLVLRADNGLLRLLARRQSSVATATALPAALTNVRRLIVRAQPSAGFDGRVKAGCQWMLTSADLAVLEEATIPGVLSALRELVIAHDWTRAACAVRRSGESAEGGVGVDAWEVACTEVYANVPVLLALAQSADVTRRLR